jgi:hypothetical protein
MPYAFDIKLMSSLFSIMEFGPHIVRVFSVSLSAEQQKLLILAAVERGRFLPLRRVHVFTNMRCFKRQHM